MDFTHRYGLQKYQLRRVFIYSRGQSPRYGSRLQIPASHLKKQFLHPCLLRRHSRAGGNPDLRLSEIFNDGRSVGFAHEYGLQKYQLRRVFIYSRGQSPRYGCRLQIPASRLKKTVPTSLPAAPSFPRRRESRPLIFRNIQRLPQYGLCPRMRFAEILVSTGRLCFTGETRHIFRRRF